MSTPAPQTPFEKFQALARRVVAVPKSAVEKPEKKKRQPKPATKRA